jgi:hypothetical protein
MAAWLMTLGPGLLITPASSSYLRPGECSRHQPLSGPVRLNMRNPFIRGLFNEANRNWQNVASKYAMLLNYCGYESQKYWGGMRLWTALSYGMRLWTNIWRDATVSTTCGGSRHHTRRYWTLHAMVPDTTRRGTRHHTRRYQTHTCWFPDPYEVGSRGNHCWLRVVSEVTGFFNLPNPSSRTVALGSAQLLTEMSTRNLSGGKTRRAGGWQPSPPLLSWL